MTELHLKLKVTFPILNFFSYGHLPEELREISKPFFDMAFNIAKDFLGEEKNEELEMMLRKLLEAKDCAVRAFINA